MFNAQVINPAYAGMWEKTGFTALIRKQWAGLNRSPLTEGISFHTPLSNENVGLGLNVMNDRFAREQRLSILADYAYEVSLTSRTRLRFGLKFGFTNYKNPLTEYALYPDYEFDRAFEEDIDLKFLPNFGVGTFLYSEDYYVGFSVPKMVQNDLKDNYHNYSTQAEIRTFYLNGGYVFRFRTLYNFVFKPTAMVRATWGAPLQYDISANFLVREMLWLGAMYRSGDALCATVTWLVNDNLRIGFAMDLTYNEIWPYQYGTYEFSMGYHMDFFGRSYTRAKYF